MRSRLPVAVCALALVAASPAWGATIPVTTTADSVAADGVVSLREAVAQASGNGQDDTITLAPGGAYAVTLCASGAITHTAADDLTILGAGATITQTCSDTPVLVGTSAGAMLTLTDLDLVGGPGSGADVQGAGVRTTGAMTLDGVGVSGIHAGSSGSVLWSGGLLPGIEITLTASALTGSDATGIKVQNGGVALTGSTITGQAESGIALIDGSPVLLTDSAVSGNGRRGVATTGRGTATITDSVIADNGDTGFACTGCLQVAISGSTIRHNGHGAAPGNGGGGIDWRVDQKTAADAPRLDIDDSLVTGNRATRSGGGILVGIQDSSAPAAPSPVLAIGGSEVSDNRTEGSRAPGGGIALLTGSLAMGDSVVVSNSSGVGGAAGTSPGGGVYAQEGTSDHVTDPHDLQLAGVVFDVNTANGGGGGIYARTAGIADLDGVRFYSNIATRNGGGIDIGADTVVRDGLFDDNSAGRGGGLSAVGFGAGDTLTVAGTTFTANSASVAGGGLAIDDTRSATVSRSTITGNTAPLGGGAVIGIDPMDEAERLTLSDSTVAGNPAASGSAVAALEGQLATRRALIVSPAGGGANCAVPAAARFPLGRSFVSDATCGAHATDVISAANPLLGPLAANGGPTPTRLPAAGSPIGGLVPAAQCLGTTDQRGVSRPKGAGCEPGSVEITEGATAR